MASAKDSPRQKMIGMMYLVLTALLALNVSKEILNAFVVVDESLGKTNQNFTANTEKLYQEFDQAKSLDPLRISPNWKKAQQVKKFSGEVDSYISNLKKELLMQTEGVDKSVSDTLQLAFTEQKDNYDVPTNIMIGESEDGSNGESRKLKDKMLDYKNGLEKFILPADKDNVKLGINLSDPVNSENKENWQMYNFYHTPLAATITILSKLQSDVKNAESVMVDYLLEKSAGDVIRFDTVAPKIIPQSNYILLGDDYKADVFVAAFSKTQNPKVLADMLNADNNAADGTFDSLVVEQGIGKYSYKPNHEGIFKWGGTISVLSSSGRKVTYPFQSEYIVARPSVNVSADNMNVFYMGLVNPVTISVPGVANEKIAPVISTGRLFPKGNGKYEVTGVEGNAAIITVMATLENGEKRNMGTVKYRVKALPKPYVQIGDLPGGGKMKLNLFKLLRGISAKYDPTFEFSITPYIKSFRLSCDRGALTIFDEESKSNQFTEEMKKAFNTFRKGDKVFISGIVAEGSDKRQHKLNEMVIKLE